MEISFQSGDVLSVKNARWILEEEGNSPPGACVLFLFFFSLDASIVHTKVGLALQQVCLPILSHGVLSTWLSLPAVWQKVSCSSGFIC